MFAIENKYLRPLPPVIIGLVAAIILLYIGSSIARFRDENAFVLTAQTMFGSGGWATWVIIGTVLIYVTYVWTANQSIWKVGTREVVYMALGATLYGVLTWVFNAIPVPLVNLISFVRPTIIIPIFFGFAFGPVVGFFTGFAGNILGDALTGLGVFPHWDIGNGLIGFVPGLVMILKDRTRTLNVLAWAAAALLVLATFLLFINPRYIIWWWVPLAGLIPLLVAHFSPKLLPFLIWLLVLGLVVRAVGGLIAVGFRDWVPILFIWAILMAVLSYFFFRDYLPWLAGLLALVLLPAAIISWITNGFNVGVLIMLILGILGFLIFERRKALTTAAKSEDKLHIDEFFTFRRRQAITTTLPMDTKEIVVWGTLGVIIGIGFTAVADIWVRGFTFIEAFAEILVPVASPSILFTILLTPLLYGAWEHAQTRTGHHSHAKNGS